MRKRIPYLLISLSFIALSACDNSDEGLKSKSPFRIETFQHLGKTVSSGTLSEKFIFSMVNDPTIEGEGFFVEFGETKFVVASSFEDNPHDLENSRRRFMAVLRGVNEFSYLSTQPINAYLEYKYKLDAEDRILSPERYRDLARQVRDIGHAEEFEMVYYKDIAFTYETVNFPCASIDSIDDIVKTTGGSVWVFAVHFSDGRDDLNLGLGTVTPDGLGLLSSFRTRVQACKGTEGIVSVTGPQFQEEIYTTGGVLSGWVGNISTVTISVLL